MKFKLPLLAVKDVERSKQFYRDVFGVKVVSDFGWNVSFSGGFAIQQNFSWLTGIPENQIAEKSNNMELYFEVDDFDGFIETLSKREDIIYVNRPMMHDWKQRVVRIYDPDYHIIEIGESMEVVIAHYLKKGMSVQEVAKVTQHPEKFVERVKNKIK